MTIYQLVSGFDYKAKKVYLVYSSKEEDTFIQMDAITVLEKKIKRDLNEDRADEIIFRKDTFLDEISFRILSSSLLNLRVVFYDDAELIESSLEELEEILKVASKLSCYTVFVTGSEKLADMYLNFYGKGCELATKGAFIDCTKKPFSKLKDFIRERFWRVEQQTFISESARDQLSKLGVSRILFNSFSVLSALHKKRLDISDLRVLNLMNENVEFRLVNRLLAGDKHKLIRSSLLGISTKGFLLGLHRKIFLLLKVKTVTGFDSIACATKLQLSLFRYFVLRQEAKNYTLKNLYEHWYLVFSLLKWKDLDKKKHPWLLFLLFMYW